ncbi:MAG: tRNA threonylcarbamoyladenosine dehydratase [Firmicutes bacterium]|nr:tRNA threonylcarbamoyladenosine dehydratase [Bacillota bacterium]
MNREQFKRTESLIGQAAVDKLLTSKVIVFGVGGVGSYVCEALARAGIGYMEIVDKDEVDVTNINRQLIALHSTIGMPKVEVCKARLKDINPSMEVVSRQCFYLPERSDEFDFSQYDYVVDAVDNVTAKLDIICKAKAAGVMVISSMGTGNKLDPMAFKVADIEKTKVCPLAKVMRKELRKRGVEGVKVVYSGEEPQNTDSRTPASISFVPSAAGLLIAKTVIDDLTCRLKASDNPCLHI